RSPPARCWYRSAIPACVEPPCSSGRRSVPRAFPARPAGSARSASRWNSPSAAAPPAAPRSRSSSCRSDIGLNHAAVGGVGPQLQIFPERCAGQIAVSALEPNQAQRAVQLWRIAAKLGGALIGAERARRVAVGVAQPIDLALVIDDLAAGAAGLLGLLQHDEGARILSQLELVLQQRGADGGETLAVALGEVLADGALAVRQLPQRLGA